MPDGRIRKRPPRSSSRSAPKTLGESNRGQQNQSTDSSVVISAEVCRSPISPWSAIAVSVMASSVDVVLRRGRVARPGGHTLAATGSRGITPMRRTPRDAPSREPSPGRRADRKSTRLNSSHANISYAVFCLKKKTSIIVILMFDAFLLFRSHALAPAQRKYFVSSDLLFARVKVRHHQSEVHTIVLQYHQYVD